MEKHSFLTEIGALHTFQDRFFHEGGRRGLGTSRRGHFPLCQALVKSAQSLPGGADRLWSLPHKDFRTVRAVQSQQAGDKSFDLQQLFLKDSIRQDSQ